MEGKLFRPGQAVQATRRAPRPILKIKPHLGVEVYLGDSIESRTILPVHFDDGRRTSYLCDGPECQFCLMGWIPRQYLYLACRLASTGHDAVACVSADVASDWLRKSPDFRNRFRIEKSHGMKRGVFCAEITTHGRLVQAWQGFDVHDEMLDQFRSKAARRV